ncbi:MAG: heavy metal-associated domain-containing protein, partial [Pseudomonadota bacterium]
MTSACPACAAAPAALELAAAQGGQSFSVPSIRCAGCIGSIERHLAQLTGVTEARVNATQRRVNIVSELSP